MARLLHSFWIVLPLMVLAGCSDTKDQAEREQAAKQAIQQGMEKEKGLVEGMMKGVENFERKMSDAKDERKK